MKSLKKTNLFAAALMLVMTLSFSASAHATNSSSSNWLSDLISSITTIVQNLKDHDWDWDWDRASNHDWDKDWDKDWNDTWSGKWKKDWDDSKKWGWSNGYNGKWYVCHRTGSSKNPYVMIQVSSSAKSAHQGHGDSVSFTDKGNGRCGPPAPSVSLSLAQDEIPVNTTTTVTWSSTDTTSCKLGNNTVATSGTANVGPYSSTGTQTITLSCSGNGGSDSESVKLKVIKAPAPKVTLSLSKSEVPQHTGTAAATWSSTNATTCTLDGTTVAIAGTANVGPYSTTGNKTITVTCTGAGGSVSGSQTLKIKAAPLPPPAAPTVSVSLQPSEMNIGATTKLAWTSTGATSCKLQGSGTLYASSFTLSNQATSGSYTKGPFPKAGQATYIITCTGSGGTTSESVTLKVGAPTPAPTVTLTLGATSLVQNGGTTTATWDSTNATTCSLTSNGTTTNNLAADGSKTVGPFAATGTQTIAVTCTGATGTTPATASKTLNVTAPPTQPTVTLTLAANELVQHGGTTTATWSSANATSCTLNNAGTTSNVGTTPGSATVGPFSTLTAQTVTITCQGATGTTPATASQTVTITAPAAPTVTLTLGSSQLPQNTGTTTASWTSANATSCTLNNAGITSSVALNSGSTPANVGPFSTLTAQTVTITCQGATGTTPATASQTVTIVPAPTVTLTLGANELVQNIGSTAASWTSTNATSCSIVSGGTTLNNLGPVSGVAGQQPVTVGPFATSSPQTVTITCVGAPGTTPATASQTLTIVVPVAPSVTLTLDANQIVQHNGTTQARWTAQNATTCTIGGTNVGIEGGPATVGPYSSLGAQTVTITCSGAPGTTAASATQTLTVIAPPAAPTVTFTVASSQISLALGSTTATWTSTNTTNCAIGGTNVGTAGSVPMGPYLELGVKTLSILCTGDGGVITASVQVNVVAVDLPPVRICARSTLGSSPAGQITWIIDYNVLTGTFVQAPTPPNTGGNISGSLAPKFGLNLTNLLQFVSGSKIEFVANGVVGRSRPNTSSNGVGAGATGQALFPIDVYLLNANNEEVFQASTTITLLGTCTGISV